MKRIFVAVDISAEARQKAADYIEKLRGNFPHIKVGWERAEKLHLTMKFLGDVKESVLPELKSIISESTKNFKPFSLKISGNGVFPNPPGARVLWLGVSDDTESLKMLQDVLETRCEKIGFEKERKKFNPHLTIARLREPEKSKELTVQHLSELFDSEPFTVTYLTIYESKLLPHGSRYSAVLKHEFGSVES